MVGKRFQTPEFKAGFKESVPVLNPKPVLRRNNHKSDKLSLGEKTFLSRDDLEYSREFKNYQLNRYFVSVGSNIFVCSGSRLISVGSFIITEN